MEGAPYLRLRPAFAFVFVLSLTLAGCTSPPSPKPHPPEPVQRSLRPSSHRARHRPAPRVASEYVKAEELPAPEENEATEHQQPHSGAQPAEASNNEPATTNLPGQIVGPPLEPEEGEGLKRPGPTIPSPQEGPASGGRLAIIIDDVGANTNRLAEFLRIPAQLTFAIIPGTRYDTQCLEMVRAHGRLAIMHLPMEPLDIHKMGPGALTTQMGDGEIKKRVEQYLAMLPGVPGMNNHMGSRATQDERVMRDVLSVAAAHNLFFVDSRTAPETVVARVADELGVRHAARSGAFLDGGGPSDAYEELLRMGRLARSHGEAIAIGHVRPGTADAIRRALPELEAQGVRVVPVSELVH